MLEGNFPGKKTCGRCKAFHGAQHRIFHHEQYECQVSLNRIKKKGKRLSKTKKQKRQKDMIEKDLKPIL
ncbi:hypothetical protein Tco_1268267 [Tanacetum coccineum]